MRDGVWLAVTLAVTAAVRVPVVELDAVAEPVALDDDDLVAVADAVTDAVAVRVAEPVAVADCVRSGTAAAIASIAEIGRPSHNEVKTKTSIADRMREMSLRQPVKTTSASKPSPAIFFSIFGRSTPSPTTRNIVCGTAR